jgi:hypothetical protein
MVVVSVAATPTSAAECWQNLKNYADHAVEITQKKAGKRTVLLGTRRRERSRKPYEQHIGRRSQQHQTHQRLSGG